MGLSRFRPALATVFLLVLITTSACSGCDTDNNGDLPDAGTIDAGSDAMPGVDAPSSDDAGSPDDMERSTDVNSAPDADMGRDATVDPDGGMASGLRLQGQLVPGGGYSMSNSFTVSGHLAPGWREQTSTSASFRLELSPPTTTKD